MPISEERLRTRLGIRKDQLAARDVVMCKLRDKIQKGHLPSTPKELADLLKMAHEYGRLAGQVDECQEILEKLSEGVPMTMEKFGVECKGDHHPKLAHMEKRAGGDVVCRHCGAKFADLHVAEKVAVEDKVGGARKDAKDSVERMLNMD